MEGESIYISADTDKVVEILSSVNNSITADSVKDMFRLGKFNSSKARPRSIMVKLIRSADVARILHEKRSLPAPFFIRPDLPFEVRRRESILLKIRWSLIEGGVERKRIRLRQGALYVDNKLHGLLNGKCEFVVAATSVLPNSGSQSCDLSLSPRHGLVPSDPSSPDMRSLNPDATSSGGSAVHVTQSPDD